MMVLCYQISMEYDHESSVIINGRRNDLPFDKHALNLGYAP